MNANNLTDGMSQPASSMFKVGDRVRITDAVHGDHEAHEYTKHHQACIYVGSTSVVAEVLDSTELYDIDVYVLADCPGVEFYADELEAVQQ